MKTTARLAERIRQRAQPLGNVGDLDPLLERIGDAWCVFLGEASHGTSEYYSCNGQQPLTAHS
jgi:erythromycin esterase-like protein